MQLPVKAILNVVIVGGLVLAAWPLAQTGYGKWSQRELAQEWQQAAKAQPRPKAKTVSRPAGKKSVNHSSVKGNAASVLMASTAPAVKRPKWPSAKIVIPDIGLEAYIVNGWDDEALRRGPAHEPNSGLPGEGNCVIAAHRNVYGSFFYKLDELIPGSEIYIETPHQKFVYSARSPIAVSEADLSILQPPPVGTAPILTLITCTLPHSPNRMVVQADLVPSEE